jgi:hypothetical protein
MGNDGGSIPGRQDLVREKARERRIENNELVRQSQSRYCALTKEPLNKPIVGDKLGLLYNKEGLIQALLEKRLPKTYSHITSLKDLKDLNITFSDDTVDIIGGEHKIKCPITMIEFSGMNCFCINWKCGCVISKKAVEELNMKDKCVQCGVVSDLKKDIVSLNLTTKEREEIYNQIIEEKLKIREKKNNKKEQVNNKLDVGNKYDKLSCDKKEILFLNKKREKTNEIANELNDKDEDENIININSIKLPILINNVKEDYLNDGELDINKNYKKSKIEINNI